jgi:glycosyltransferase involved in cell wall biosynthesis
MIEKRVSAVITAYNSEAFIADAIKSVLDQSRVVDEIVVVDDGSTDGTRRVVTEFEDQGIKYILQPNSSAGAARNRGLRETSGDYIAFLDADDFWLPNKIRQQIHYLENNPSAALVSGFARWWNVTKDTVRISGKRVKDMKTLRREILVHNVIGNPSMVMLRRSALEDVGVFDDSIRWGQDWDLWIRLVEKYDANVLEEPLTVYRWHQDNLSHVRRWERLLSYWNVSRKAIRGSKPAWRRPWLLMRSWSNQTYRRAMYAIRFKYPRWRQIYYAALALCAYPFEMTREKVAAVIRALFGEKIYQGGRNLIGSHAQTGGQE